MRRNRRIEAILLALIPCASTALAQENQPPSLPPDVELVRDIEYGTGGRRPSRLDLLRPRDAGPRPFFVMHDDRDDLVPIDQSGLFVEALKKAGVPVEYHVVEGAGHGFGGPEVMGRVERFFDGHLKPKIDPDPSTQRKEGGDQR